MTARQIGKPYLEKYHCQNECQHIWHGHLGYLTLLCDIGVTQEGAPLVLRHLRVNDWSDISQSLLLAALGQIFSIYISVLKFSFSYIYIYFFSLPFHFSAAVIWFKSSSISGSLIIHYTLLRICLCAHVYIHLTLEASTLTFTPRRCACIYVSSLSPGLLACRRTWSI